MKQIFFTFFLLLIVYSVQSQQPFVVRLKESSQLTINGSTNINTFSFHQSGDKMKQREVTLTGKMNGNRIEASKHQVGIAVREFKSADKIAQVAFYSMMKTDQYPSLYIRLLHYDLIQTGSKTTKGKAYVDITIVGKTQRYEIPVSTERNGSNWRFTGSKRLTIKDFGLTPPEPVFGLVKVSDWIDIQLDLHCIIENDQLATN